MGILERARKNSREIDRLTECIERSKRISYFLNAKGYNLDIVVGGEYPILTKEQKKTVNMMIDNFLKQNVKEAEEELEKLLPPEEGCADVCTGQ